MTNSSTAFTLETFKAWVLNTIGRSTSIPASGVVTGQDAFSGNSSAIVVRVTEIGVTDEYPTPGTGYSYIYVNGFNYGPQPCPWECYATNRRLSDLVIET